MNIKLVVRGGKLAGREILVRTNQFVIGRDESCNLRPASNAVSKLHCAIIQSDDGIWLRDMKSTNGTFLNGQRVADKAALHHKDEVRVGPLVFEVHLPQATASTPSVDRAEPAGKPAAKKPDKPTRRSEVNDEDVFEWLSEDDAGEEMMDADRQARLPTTFDMTLNDTETVPDIGQAKPTPSPPPAAKDDSTSAAANALKNMMLRKRT
jgi:predicted component of type VI protein secretion system